MPNAKRVFGGNTDSFVQKRLYGLSVYLGAAVPLAGHVVWVISEVGRYCCAQAGNGGGVVLYPCLNRAGVVSVSFLKTLVNC